MCSTNHPVRCLTGINILYEGVLFSSLRVNTNRQAHRLDILNIKATSKRCASLNQAFLGFSEYRREYIGAALKITNTNPVWNDGDGIQTLFHINVIRSRPRAFKVISSTEVVT